MVDPLLASDIAAFLALAEDEGWMCDRWEFQFLLRNFPQGCFVRREAGSGIGYITAARYGSSGWIGNLLVHPGARRRGIGRGLMELAMSALQASGVETIWLTASEQGVGIYRRLGFAAIDHIHRWTGRGTAAAGPRHLPVDHDLVATVDSGGWGERRDELMEAVCARGRFLASSAGFLCCQSWEGGTQIGPWGCLEKGEAGDLLEYALAGAGERVFLDVPAGNDAAAELLRENGFTVQGSNLLMFQGRKPLYRADQIFALASMGSMG
ncbi:GNAT family N-acetyltransferase [Geomonas sp.]|uniref:GNAT family N-acetyltransferase n=1 Tax=Geomonas sp. TaxID=2651584 RepID=UPI002B496216|nr:GNAT family N-acetyltransferase [Geomonas sp.]HJV35906.1 GNAT family N-acetyltransferase [Geomonas sp.]